MTRRGFFRSLFAVLPSLTLANAQKKALEDRSGKAVVCENGTSAKCPQGHETCRYIDAALVVGNGSTDYPEWGQLNNYRMLWCMTCGSLFAEKRY